MVNGYGIIGLGLLGSSVATSLSGCTSCGDFEESLSVEQQARYKLVARQRFRTAMTGLLIGVILAIAYYYIACYKSNTKMGYTHSMIILSILLGVQYFYYSFAPKTSMLPYLTNNLQREKWLKVYDTMKFRFHAGFVLGILACAVICFSMQD